MPQIPESVIRVVAAARSDLVQRRAELVAPLDREIAELDRFLEGSDHTGESESHKPATAADFEVKRPNMRRELNRRALEAAYEHLKLWGSPATSAELHDEVVSCGIFLQAADPAGRLVQLLSNDERFQSQRGRGWSLTPAAAAVGKTTEASIESVVSDENQEEHEEDETQEEENSSQ